MSGIYIHIPYCRQKCNYCNFFSLASKRYRDELVPAIGKELELRKDYLPDPTIHSVYFGGGTPSLIEPEEIAQLLETIRSNYQPIQEPEITLEANPDDLTVDRLRQYREIGINRLSIGIQSFNQRDLEFLNRVHTVAQSYDCIDFARVAGFNNISIDLIYGIPTLNHYSWESNLMTALKFKIPHISAYALTIEEKTPLSLMIRRGTAPGTDEEAQLRHFDILLDMMNSNGYFHYEISNFCRPTYYSRHNSAYWNGTPYLGAGPSAHSYNGISRQWNVSNLTWYIESIHQNTIPSEEENLTLSQQFNEYVMTSLRTMWGCDLRLIEQKFGKEWLEQIHKDIQNYLKEGLVIISDKKLYLTRKGKFQADGIAAELFRV